jgi:VanZ family protein
VLRKLLLPASIVYTIVLIILSLISLDGMPSLGSSFDDKIYHVVAYTGLALLWVFYFKPFRTKYIPFIVCVTAAFLGFVLELLQFFVNPNRSYDTFDLIANTIGAIIGMFIAIKLNIHKLK